MQTGIRFIAQCYDIASGETIEESILRDDKLLKADTLKELGYLHIEQINFSSKDTGFQN